MFNKYFREVSSIAVNTRAMSSNGFSAVVLVFIIELLQLRLKKAKRTIEPSSLFLFDSPKAVRR
jgi:hypothetical protein